MVDGNALLNDLSLHLAEKTRRAAQDVLQLSETPADRVALCCAGAATMIALAANEAADLAHLKTGVRPSVEEAIEAVLWRFVAEVRTRARSGSQT